MYGADIRLSTPYSGSEWQQWVYCRQNPTIREDYEHSLRHDLCALCLCGRWAHVYAGRESHLNTLVELATRWSRYHDSLT
jgi:hypothetical protein